MKKLGGTMEKSKTVVNKAKKRNFQGDFAEIENVILFH